jgi:hypothetical protein
MRTLVDDGVDLLSAGEELFPAAVTITRTSKEDFGSRQLEVSIDGEHVATLLFGDSITRELLPGSHRLRIHNTLVWKTVDFTLNAHEQIFFEAVNKAGPGTYLMMLVVGIGPLYVHIKRMS